VSHASPIERGRCRIVHAQRGRPHKCAVWVIGLLDIKPNNKVLEVGFGPGLGIQFDIRAKAFSISPAAARTSMPP
jgi:hypothetical protein